MNEQLLVAGEPIYDQDRELTEALGAFASQLSEEDFITPLPNSEEKGFWICGLSRKAKLGLYPYNVYLSSDGRLTAIEWSAKYGEAFCYDLPQDKSRELITQVEQRIKERRGGS